MQWNPDECPEDSVEEVLSSLENEKKALDDEMANAEEVLSLAMQRIEEANLFKLLIKDTIFKTGSASPEILASVNKKIRQFALEQLEELLGIKQPKPEPVIEKSQFDLDQIVALRSLANKVLKRENSKEPPEDFRERRPELVPISTHASPQISSPQLKSITPTPSAQPKKMQKTTTAKTTSKVAAPRPPQKKPGRAGGGVGYATSTRKGLPMPTADQLIATMAAPAPVIQNEITGSAGNVAAATTGSLVQALVQQLTGGNLVTQAADESADDINERM